MKNIRAIVATDSNGGIGFENRLPWPHNPVDMAWFKSKTVGSTVIMGRNTWESLGSKPLPKRKNVIVSSKLVVDNPEVDVYESVIAAVCDITDDAWLIGGAKVYETSWHLCQEIYQTRIDGSFKCDKRLDMSVVSKFGFGVAETIHLADGVEVDIWKRGF